MRKNIVVDLIKYTNLSVTLLFLLITGLCIIPASQGYFPSGKDHFASAKTLEEYLKQYEPPSSDFLTYSDAVYNISMDYPRAWELRTYDEDPNDPLFNLMTFVSPVSGDKYRPNVYLFVHELNILQVSTTVDQYLTNTIELYKSSKQGFRLINSDLKAHLAGYSGYRFVSTYNADFLQGSLVKEMQIGTIIGNKVVYVQFFAEPQEFELYLPVVQRMIDSVKFNFSARDLPTPPANQNDTTSAKFQFVDYENLPWKIRIKHLDYMNISEEVDDGTSWDEIKIYSYYNIVRFSFPEGSVVAGITITIGRVGEAGLRNYTSELISSYGRGGGRDSFRLIGSDFGHSSLSDNPAYRFTYTYVEDNRTLQVLDTGTIENKMVYYIQYYAIPELFDKYKEVVEKMINSFEILDLSGLPSKEPNSAEESNLYPGVGERGMRIYKNETDWLRLIHYPSTWHIIHENTGQGKLNQIKFDSMARSSYPYNVILAKVILDGDMGLQQIAAARIQSFRLDPKYTTTFTLVSSQTDANLLDLPAYQLFYTYSNPNGGNDIILTQEIGTKIHNEVYRLTYSALVSEFAKHAPIAQEMKNSLVIKAKSSTLTNESAESSVPEI